MNKEKVVVSIGGSILIPGKNDHIFMKDLAKMLIKANDDIQLVVVCGGGIIARYYTETSSQIGATVYQQDLLGIGTTRLNAGLLALALGDRSSTTIPLTVEDAASKTAPDNIVVMGGTEPGHTTDAVATMVAKAIGASRVVNATSVDAVYTDDPRKNPDAKRISELTIDQLDELVYKEHGAGKSSVFDPLGVQIAKKEHIDILMTNGRDLEDLENAILGRKIKGTYVNSH